MFLMPFPILHLIRYHDVIFNDTTYSCNRFQFPLNVTVGVDCEGKTRILALALISGESSDDFSWVLRHLLAGGNNKPPQVFMTDQDTGMESALKSVMPGVTIVNCLWHIIKNLECAAGARRKEEAKKLFMRAQKSLTIREFDSAWGPLQKIAPSGSSFCSNISRLRGRTGMWASHTVGYIFTAGSVTNQRVENAHSHLKNKLNSKSTLDDVFIMTEERAIKENLKHEELCYRRGPLHSKWRTRATMDDFREIVTENNELLGGFARFKMIDEMTESYFYRVMEIDLRDLEVIE
jgi:hypothetical protein